MKQWFLIDTLKDGKETVTVLDVKENDNMYTIFRSAWEHLSKEEKERRASFKAAFCKADENGKPDLNTSTDTWHVK